MAEMPRREKTREELLDALLKAEDKIDRLKRLETRRKQTQKMFEEITYDLRERVKELNCLYSISNIVERQGISLEEVLQGTVDILPDAWQYPEITCSRIALKDRTFSTANFRETPWKQVQAIADHGKTMGTIEIYYLEEKPDKDEGPFLREERSLINVIAERVGEIIERKRAEESLLESEAHNRALLSAIPDLMFQVNGDGVFLGFHKGKFAELEKILKGLIGRPVYVLSDEKKMLPRRTLEQGMIYVGRALTTGKIQVFEQHISLSGKPRDFEVRIVVSRKNEVLGMVQDITLRKRLEREILEISGREQRRIGQDLHDSLSQHLAGIGFLGKALERKISSGAQANTQDASEIVNLLDQAITLTRGFARGLNPVQLEAGGLVHALSELAANTERLFGVRCRFEHDNSTLVNDNTVAIHLYRIAQEALNNAIKHGKADIIHIAFERKGAINILSVRDNGTGFTNPPGHSGGMGINIMNYRASMVGASLDIRNGKGGGAIVSCSLQDRTSSQKEGVLHGTHGRKERSNTQEKDHNR
jgi:signal transduction histidine kinase